MQLLRLQFLMRPTSVSRAQGRDYTLFPHKVLYECFRVNLLLWSCAGIGRIYRARFDR